MTASRRQSYITEDKEGKCAERQREDEHIPAALSGWTVKSAGVQQQGVSLWIPVCCETDTAQVQLSPNEHFYDTRKHNTDCVSSRSFDFHFCICVAIKHRRLPLMHQR